MHTDEGVPEPELEQECIRRIAEAKRIDPESIHSDTTLDALAVDSLDRVTLSFDLEEKYGVEIPETDLHAIKTVGDVAAAVERAITKKQRSNPAPADPA